MPDRVRDFRSNKDRDEKRFYFHIDFGELRGIVLRLS